MKTLSVSVEMINKKDINPNIGTNGERVSYKSLSKQLFKLGHTKLIKALNTMWLLQFHSILLPQSGGVCSATCCFLRHQQQLQ